MANCKAEQYNALAKCRSQSSELEQIHACMDGYLDTIDGNMRSIADFLGESFNPEARLRLRQAQQTFLDYRRDNCLWYTDFSATDAVANQVAKNCVANMTRARLQELYGLVTANAQGSQVIEGYYVREAEQNYFQPCGRTERYWVNGEAGLSDLLRQNYSTFASNEGQRLHAMFVGRLNSQVQSQEFYQGILQLDALMGLRVPTGEDCSQSDETASGSISASDIDEPDTVREVFDDEVPQLEEPEQQLAAYFGDWIVDCFELRGQKSCKMEVNLTKGGDESGADRSSLSPRLVVNRASEQSTFIQVVFPERVIQSPTLVRWQIDQTSLGDIAGSKISVDPFEARLLVNESEFLVNELMPLLRDGSRIVFSVQASSDGGAGDTFAGNLQGFSNSLAFVDDFLSGNS